VNPFSLPTGTEDIPYLIHTADLLQGFSDVDGDSLSVSGLTATNGSLVDNNNGTHTFTPNPDYNGPVTLTYTVTDGNGGATPASQSFSLVPVEDVVIGDAQLAFSAAEFKISEDGTPVNQVTVTRTGNTSGEVGATLTISNGTATVPEDVNPTSLSVTLAPGQTRQTVTIPVIDDSLFEGDETLILTLELPTNSATIGTQATATLTIVDNDPAPEQPVTGTGNSDNLIGTTGNNTFVGINLTSTTPGRNEKDSFTGGLGADRFTLGDANRVYYDDISRRSAGLTDYALITDFNPTEGDVIQLKGTAGQYLLGSSPISILPGTALFWTAG
jgi:hypothetical protein